MESTLDTFSHGVNAQIAGEEQNFNVGSTKGKEHTVDATGDLTHAVVGSTGRSGIPMPIMKTCDNVKVHQINKKAVDQLERASFGHKGQDVSFSTFGKKAGEHNIENVEGHLGRIHVGSNKKIGHLMCTENREETVNKAMVPFDHVNEKTDATAGKNVPNYTVGSNGHNGNENIINV